MYKKYNDVSDYKNDLMRSITLISECMNNLEKEVSKFSNIDRLYFNSKTSAGLSCLLKKLNINSDILANRLRITNNLIGNTNSEYAEYREITKNILSEIEDKLNRELKMCRNSLYNAMHDEMKLLDVKEFFLQIYIYILKNVFMESFYKKKK
jgi:hypothetical protein